MDYVEKIENALGGLTIHIESLPPEVATEAAEVILQWASGKPVPVPGNHGHPGNVSVLARSLHAFGRLPVWVSLSAEARARAANLLLYHVRQGPGQTFQITGTHTESPFLSALLAAAQPGVYHTYPREVRREISDAFFRIVAGSAGALRPGLVISLAREHLFRNLADPQRLTVARWLLDAASRVDDMAFSGFLDRLSCQHVFRVLSETERRYTVNLFVQYAGQDLRVTGHRSMVRLRTDPAAVSLTGLAKSHVFRNLTPSDQERVAILMLDYAGERLPLNPTWPENDDTRERGIKGGLDGLRREWVFNALGTGSKQEAVRLLLRYAERGPVRRSAEDPTRFTYDQTRHGFSGRARRALARPFVRSALSPEDQKRADDLGILRSQS